MKIEQTQYYDSKIIPYRYRVSLPKDNPAIVEAISNPCPGYDIPMSVIQKELRPYKTKYKEGVVYDYIEFKDEKCLVMFTLRWS